MTCRDACTWRVSPPKGGPWVLFQTSIKRPSARRAAEQGEFGARKRVGCGGVQVRPSLENDSYRRRNWVRMTIQTRPSPSSAAVGSTAPEWLWRPPEGTGSSVESACQVRPPSSE